MSLPVDMRDTRAVASWSSVMESSSRVRRPEVRGTSRTLRVDVSVNWEVREVDRSQAWGILAKTDSRFDFASSCQFAIGGAEDMVVAETLFTRTDDENVK